MCSSKILNDRIISLNMTQTEWQWKKKSCFKRSCNDFDIRSKRWQYCPTAGSMATLGVDTSSHQVQNMANVFIGKSTQDSRGIQGDPTHVHLGRP